MVITAFIFCEDFCLDESSSDILLLLLNCMKETGLLV